MAFAFRSLKMNKSMLQERITRAIDRLQSDLVSMKGSSNHWTGALSTSALSTATAISALSVCRDQFAKNFWGQDDDSSGSKYSLDRWQQLIERGSDWLSRSQNPDGGFGDTDRSLSNIATTFLVLAAWQLAGHNARYSTQISAAWSYVERQGSWDGLRQRYGKDKTFVVPIMTNCALAGIVDWGKIPTLPFEAAAFAAVLVSLRSASCGQLCHPCVSRNRSSSASSSTSSQSVDRLGAETGKGANIARAHTDAANKRWLSGSSPVDQLCLNEFSVHRAWGLESGTRVSQVYR